MGRNPIGNNPNHSASGYEVDVAARRRHGIFNEPHYVGSIDFGRHQREVTPCVLTPVSNHLKLVIMVSQRYLCGYEEPPFVVRLRPNLLE
jgi:hypothetical protein